MAFWIVLFILVCLWYSFSVSKLFEVSIVRILSTLFLSIFSLVILLLRITSNWVFCVCYLFSGRKKNLFVLCFHQLFDLIPFAKMIKGSFREVCQSLSSDIERFCYIIWTNRKETERASERKKVEIYWMLWTQLTKFFQWKWIDVKILRRQTLDNDDDNNGNEEKLYTLHKSFKPLFFIEKFIFFSFWFVVRFFLSSCHQTWFRI